MKEQLPEHFKKFVEKYPEVWDAHKKMTEACAECGPLDRKTRELVKMAAAAASNQETAVERHAVMATQHGASQDEIFQTILLLTTVVGFPRASAALQWAQRGLTDK